MNVWGFVIVVYLLVDVALRIVALIIVPRNRTPQSGTAWLLLVFIFPGLGLLLFLLIGSNHVPARRRAKQREIARIIAQSSRNLGVSRDVPGAPTWLAEVVELNRSLGAMPLVGGNEVRLISDSTNAFDEMIAAIDAARSSVHVQFYILTADPTTAPFFSALQRAQNRGVNVLVLLDFWASRRLRTFHATSRLLEQIGCSWAFTLPLRPFHGQYQRPDLRNHRKIVVVDDLVGFMGSQNLIDSSYDRGSSRRTGMHWVDLMARVEGAAALELNAVFSTDWFIETGELLKDDHLGRALERAQADRPVRTLCQIVPSGPGYADGSNMQMFLTLLYHARKRVTIVSPYFVPNEAMLFGMRNAAARGVFVELFVPEVWDHFLVHHAQVSYYRQLLDMGIHIMLYAGPNMLHAKYVSVDGVVAAIGSSNMDMRSFNLNMEVTMLTYGEQFMQDLGVIGAQYRGRSHELTIADWEKRGRLQHIVDNLMRLTSSLQ